MDVNTAFAMFRWLSELSTHGSIWIYADEGIMQYLKIV